MLPPVLQLYCYTHIRYSIRYSRPVFLPYSYSIRIRQFQYPHTPTKQLLVNDHNWQFQCSGIKTFLPKMATDHACVNYSLYKHIFLFLTRKTSNALI